jgi:hypothetical protein
VASVVDIDFNDDKYDYHATIRRAIDGTVRGTIGSINAVA